MCYVVALPRYTSATRRGLKEKEEQVGVVGVLIV